MGSSNFQEILLVFLENWKTSSKRIIYFSDDKPCFWCDLKVHSPSSLMERNNQFCVFHVSRWPRWSVAENFCFFRQQSRVRVQRQAESSRGVRKRKHGKRGTPSATPPYHYMEELLSPHITRRESIKQPRSMHPKKNTWREKKPQKAF